MSAKFTVQIVFLFVFFSVSFRCRVLGQPPNLGAVLFGAGRQILSEEGALDPIVVGGVPRRMRINLYVVQSISFRKHLEGKSSGSFARARIATSETRNEFCEFFFFSLSLSLSAILERYTDPIRRQRQRSDWSSSFPKREA